MTDHAPTKSAKKASRASRPRTYHQCPFCSHSSYRAHNMREHILTHDPNRPKDFKCVRCEKAFARKHDLKRHVKTHERRRQHDGLPRVIFI
ncbi:hypothetical protein BCR43DRAFT_435114 [Syncephalastrum racemosum]|uniref:C2H2-type domain-containing protein n=1 Tax=Syncephalastrum racemosum TaxID=13706 RepID=A0A1X2HKT6_SYNRA|nr:hypothetical protein BCR43DRAFT_435114 [Syncephalastrum racemosum]